MTAREAIKTQVHDSKKAKVEIFSAASWVLFGQNLKHSTQKQKNSEILAVKFPFQIKGKWQDDDMAHDILSIFSMASKCLKKKLILV